MSEIWKDIPGCLGYEASDQGRIRNKRNSRVLSASPNNRGYTLTTLSIKRDSRRAAPYRALVHRLVLSAFLGYSDLQVNHKNGDKTDNRLDNLEYCTARANVLHAINELGVAYGGDRRRKEVNHVHS